METRFSASAELVGRYLGACCLIAGPLIGLLIRAVEPTANSTQSVTGYVIDYAAQPARTEIMLVLDAFVWLMLPAALVAAGLAWRRAPFLSLVGGVMSLVGWVGVVMVVAQDALIATASGSNHDPAQAASLVADWTSSGVVVWYTMIFVVGHLAGTLLIGAALWRARAIARWAAAFVAVSMPLHLVAYVSGIQPLDVLAWSMLLVGFAVCAPPLLRGTVARDRQQVIVRPQIAVG
jgi:hypothetical protein